jgi:hypothetical protein
MGESDFSLHLINGSTEFQALLFILIGLVACAFLIGYKTKLMNILLWFLVISLQTRNSWILDNGDLLLQLCLFWGAFLPLNLRWSIDALINPKFKEVPERYSSVGAFALVIQIFCIYIFTALLKNDATWRSDFTALYYALSLEQFSMPIGQWLVQFVDTTRFLTLAAILIEFYAPILIVFPLFNRYTRLIGILSLGMLHTGIAITMHVGIFPIVDIATLAVLLPTDFWVSLKQLCERRWGKLEKRKQQLRNMIKRFQTLLVSKIAVRPAPVRAWEKSLVISLVALVCTFYVVLINITSYPGSNVAVPESLRVMGDRLKLAQSWSMFAPSPSNYDGWMIVKAKQVNGREIDLFNQGKDISYAKPAQVAELFGYNRWVKFFEQSIRSVDMLNPYADYMCRKWNDSQTNPEDKVNSLEIIFMEEVTPPPGEPTQVNELRLHDYNCFY